jgi:hypothetical protein
MNEAKLLPPYKKRVGHPGPLTVFEEQGNDIDPASPCYVFHAILIG